MYHAHFRGTHYESWFSVGFLTVKTQKYNFREHTI